MLDAYVYDVVRTPRGRVKRAGGTLAGVPPYELVGQLLHALDRRLDLPAREVAVQILDDDPELKAHQELAEEVEDLLGDSVEFLFKS